MVLDGCIALLGESTVALRQEDSDELIEKAESLGCQVEPLQAQARLGSHWERFFCKENLCGLFGLEALLGTGASLPLWQCAHGGLQVLP